MDVAGRTVIEDYVRGPVTFEHGAIEDFIVARSDGTPTYNLAAAVDDLEMGITHVIRGEDHISNTPKQMMVIRALGGAPPDYAHIPLILGDGPQAALQAPRGGVGRGPRGGRLPARAPSVNALALLGWSFDDKTTILHGRRARRGLLGRPHLQEPGDLRPQEADRCSTAATCA